MEFIYNGERSKEELIHFVMRMSGPPVQLVTRTDSVDMLKASHPIFFAYIGRQEGLLWDTYASVAETFQPHGFFYATSMEIAREHFDIDTLPAVIVYKERSHFYYPCKFCLISFFFTILVQIFYCLNSKGATSPLPEILIFWCILIQFRTKLYYI